MNIGTSCSSLQHSCGTVWLCTYSRQPISAVKWDKFSFLQKWLQWCTGGSYVSRSSSPSLSGFKWNQRIFGVHACSRRLCLGNGEGADPDVLSDIEKSPRSFLGRLLEQALAIFVNSQLEGCGKLLVSVDGRNDELLSGQVGKVQIYAREAIYKGIFMSSLHLTASAIKLSFPNTRILEQPIYVNLSVFIKEQDLISSLSSPLLQEFLLSLMPQFFTHKNQLSVLHAKIEQGFFHFSTKPVSSDNPGLSGDTDSAIALHVEALDDGHRLRVRYSSHGYDDEFVKNFNVGPEVCLNKLQICHSAVLLAGSFLVKP